jgi:hypothetical protein
MQQGWAFRRALENDAGRAALRFAAASGVAPPGSYAACRNQLEKYAFLAGLARRATEPALREIVEIGGSDDAETRNVARAALGLAYENALARAQRRPTSPRSGQGRPKTKAPQEETRIPAVPRAMKAGENRRPPTNSSTNR